MRKIVDLVSGLENGQVALYIDKYGEFTATSSPNTAMTSAVGKIMITDEAGNDHGKPVFNGIAVDVYGGGEGYLYLSKHERETNKVYVTMEDYFKVPAGGKVSIAPHKDLSKAEVKAYRIANEFYMQIVNGKIEK